MGIRRSAAEYGSAISDQQLSVDGTARALTVPATAIAAMVTNGAEPIRVRWGTPTASVGHYLNPYSGAVVINVIVATQILYSQVRYITNGF